MAILGGTGQAGRGLAQRFARAGVSVIVGSRDEHRARETVAGWTLSPGGPAIEAAANSAAVARAGITVLAVPFATVDLLLEELQPHFTAGSLVIVLLWVYYSAQILFFGAKFTQIYSNRYGSHLETGAARGSSDLKDHHL